MQRGFTDSAESLREKIYLVCAAAHRDVQGDRTPPHRRKALGSRKLLSSVDQEGTVMVKTVIVNIEAVAARRQVEVLARIVLIAMVILLTVGAMKLF